MNRRIQGLKMCAGTERKALINRIAGSFPSSLMIIFIMSLAIAGCNSSTAPTIVTPTVTPAMSVQDVQTLMAHAVEQAERIGERINVAVLDREGNTLGVFRMTGAPQLTPPLQSLFGEIAKARTAAYLSSNQHAFTTMTACFITRSHFPPTSNNTSAGPLFGVPFSSRSDSDVQPNGGPLPPLGPAQPPAPPQNGLTNIPGGVPVFVNGMLAGGLGISGGSDTFTQLNTINDQCLGVTKDEIIALGAVGEYAPPQDKRGDNVFLDGIQLLYANTSAPAGNFTLTFNDLATRGAVDPNFPIRASLPPKFPPQGEVAIDALHNYMIRGGSVLTESDVRQIVNQAVARANTTRAAIRRPIGSPARVFITVADLDGTILAVYRTPDATIFSYDVSAQKARTVVAFSNPNDPLGAQFRSVIGAAANQPIAVSTRTMGFLSQRYYPPGIDQGTPTQTIPPEMGPFYQYVDGQLDFQFQRLLPTRAPFQNGITIFPGGLPLYKNGQLAGGIGISGDGVDQDDYIAMGGSAGFQPPVGITADVFSYRGTNLAYYKQPRQPGL